MFTSAWSRQVEACLKKETLVACTARVPQGKTERRVAIERMSDSRKGLGGYICYVSDMVVLYETMMDEATSRQTTKESSLAEGHTGGRLYYESAKAIASIWGLCEDEIVGLRGGTQAERMQQISALRQK
jgi:hypothetical protein